MAASAISQGAVVLVSESFGDLGLGPLNGTQADINTINTNGWVGNATFIGNGADGLSVPIEGSRSVSLDMGANYFATNPGIYVLSLDISLPTVSSSSWVGFGFAEKVNSADNLVGNNGAPWMLFRLNGQVNVYAGKVGTNLVQIGSTTATTANSVHTFRLELDTSKAQWSLNAWVDSTQLDLNGSSAGASYTYTTNPNPTDIRHLQIATSLNQGQPGGTATVDNFKLTATVPEPGAFLAMTGGLAVLGMFHRIRRPRV